MQIFIETNTATTAYAVDQTTTVDALKAMIENKGETGGGGPGASQSPMQVTLSLTKQLQFKNVFNGLCFRECKG